MICWVSFNIGAIVGFIVGGAVVGFALLYWMFAINGPIN